MCTVLAGGVLVVGRKSLFHTSVRMFVERLVLHTCNALFGDTSSTAPGFEKGGFPDGSNQLFDISSDSRYYSRLLGCGCLFVTHLRIISSFVSLSSCVPNRLERISGVSQNITR